jgi:hypothetical protein
MEMEGKKQAQGISTKRLYVILVGVLLGTV